ncbi:PD-(D/E)XK motif protein [Mycolicibacterium elephantis]|uniref:PD-(D/E)XK motif protein n=1 Tax=Mycolicibacterium elephantis TaxID=81858 RepID=UPI000B01C2EB|nr:PD-(D/E)XK motif protein [Mycolicibacterium elephantis]
MIDPEIWRELASETADDGTVVRRRVLPALNHDVFVGERRPSRERVLWLDIREQSIGLPKRLPSSRGLDVGVDTGTRGVTKIRLSSTAEQGNPLFEELANDVANVLLRNPGQGAAVRVMERVIGWQNFFAQRGDEFGGGRAAGLFAELAVLRDVFISSLDPRVAVAAWTGPDPAIQDFQLGTVAVEVKSFRGSGPGRLTITSERQLETTGVLELYIAFLKLDQRRDGTGVSLMDTIDAVRTALASSTLAQDMFATKLLSYGWHDKFAAARIEKYEIRSLEMFAVQPDFPRIVSSGLPMGVGGVSYSVDRSAIDEFLISTDEFADRLKEQQI